MEPRPFVEIVDLYKYFKLSKHNFSSQSESIKAVDGVSFKLEKGETLGLVGESGCGKSTLGRLILRLIEPTKGEIFVNGENILTYRKKELRNLRKKMQIIFQDPYSSLNPRMTTGDLVGEPFDVFGTLSKNEKINEVLRLLNLVGLDDASFEKYPHEFSGGQRQRIGIARAIALNPELIICDEPVSALDVSIRSQILNLLKSLQVSYHLTYLFISHDLSVVKHISDRVIVMYLGKICEISSNEKLFDSPLHPYTKALISAITIPNPKVKKHRIVLIGDVPSPINIPSGCRFHPRCSYSLEICKHSEPKLKSVGSNRYVACHLY